MREPFDPSRRWLSFQKAERMAGDVGHETGDFQRMAMSGKAPGHISASGVLFFYEDELAAWIEEQRPGAEARKAAARERHKPYPEPRSRG